MKLIKSISNSIQGFLALIDNLVSGTNELSLIYKEACEQARKEQALESLKELKDLQASLKVTDKELASAS